jgi:hypothetical protein
MVVVLTAVMGVAVMQGVVGVLVGVAVAVLMQGVVASRVASHPASLRLSSRCASGLRVAGSASPSADVALSLVYHWLLKKGVLGPCTDCL